MSREMSKATGLVFKSAWLSAGLAILVGSGGAIAAQPQPQLLAQSGGDIIIDETGGSPSSTTTPTVSDGTRFSCQYVNGQYTVMYHPESRPGESFAWATPRSLGDGWTPQRRCEAISQRLESYRPDGLVDMRTAVQNRYNVVCVTTDRVPGCRIVLTVPPGQNAELVRNQIFENLTVADSGQSTLPVSALNGRNSNPLGGLLGSSSQSRRGPIPLKPFLDRADGGTGTRIRNGVRTTAPAPSTPSNTRPSKPAIFR